MTQPTPPKRRRRWSSISLRGLMILVLVLGGLMGWKVRRASLQRRAVARLEKLRGSVVYDWQQAGHAVFLERAAETPGPTWLRKLIGDEYFQEVVAVSLPDPFESDPKLPEPPSNPDNGPEWERYQAEYQRIDQEYWESLARDQLACLEGLDRLESLHYYGPRLNPEGEARLGNLSRLEGLRTSTPLDDEGLAQVAKLTRLERLETQLKLSDPSVLGLLVRLPKLKELRLSGEVQHVRGMAVRGVEGPDQPDKITDAWLAEIARLRHLTRLSLDGAEITDDGLRPLKHLERLESLSFDSPLVTDAGLAHLEALKSLEYLSITPGKNLTGDGMVHLQGLTKLESLFLSILPMNNIGLWHIQKLPNLKDLGFSRGKLDDATLKEFQAARPKVSLTITPSLSSSQ